MSGKNLLSRLHLGLTIVLLLAFLTVAGLAAAGRVHFGKPNPGGDQTSADKDRLVEDGARDNPSAGRYQIEQVKDADEVLEIVGRLGYLGESTHEVWVFRYQGGFIETRLETDFDGKSHSGELYPSDWKAMLSRDEGLLKDLPGALHKRGYIILTAVRNTPLHQALGSYHVHLGSLLAGAPVGPLHTLVPLHLEVRRHCPYRLLLNAGPMPKTPGTSFNIWGGEELLMRGPMIPRNPQEEDYHVSVGKDFQPGKEILLLDRQRGYSRLRLKARFLGDGEVRQYAKQ